jgi:hypothetical protein
MARFRNLQDVAAGMLGAFVSRNNDIDGYWALGMLCADHRNGSGATQLRLHERCALPVTPSAGLMVARFADRLGVMLAHHGFVPADLAAATIAVEFDIEANIPPGRWPLSGKPFRCTVVLTDRPGRSFIASDIGRCAQHNAGAQRRSARAGNSSPSNEP